MIRLAGLGGGAVFCVLGVSTVLVTWSSSRPMSLCSSCDGWLAGNPFPASRSWG